MCDIKPMLFQLINITCVPEHMLGSPSYGAIKYEIPECDLMIVRRRVRVPVGEKINKFGMKLRHGGHWIEWEIAHAACMAHVHRLESFGVQHGKYVRDYFVDNAMMDGRVIPKHVEWVGDTQVLLDALTYLNMMQE
jgi:hypothetical protein